MGNAPIRFDVFQVDPQLGELRRDDVRVPIQDLPFRLLLILLERPNAVVSRDELRERLWNDTVIDFDSGLNTAVRKLRDALGDDAERPRFVETVPRRGYRLRVPDQPVPDQPSAQVVASQAAAPHTGIRSTSRWLVVAALAVAATVSIGWLAFRDQPGTPRLLITPFASAASDQPLADEITDELIGHIGRVDTANLEVLGPMTARRYRPPTPEIPGSLGASHVLTGRLLREGSAFRLTLSLSRVSDGVQTWSDVVEAHDGNVAEVAASLVTTVARAVVAHLGVVGEVSQARAATLSRDAFEKYAQGRSAWYQFNPDAHRQSHDLFDAAVRADAGFADAYIGRADAANMIGLSGDANAADFFVAAERDARAAIALAPNDARAHGALGLALLYGKAAGGEADVVFQRALKLDPASAMLHQWAAGAASARGRHEVALEHAQRAHGLDPESLAVNVDLAWYYYYARRFADAIRQAEHTAQLTNGPAPWFCLQLAHRQAGNDDGEMTAYVELLRRFSASPDAAVLEARDARARAGMPAVRQLQLARLKTATSEPHSYVMVTAALAAKDRTVALATVQKAALHRPPWWLFVDVDPAFDAVRDDPEFRAVLPLTHGRAR